MSITNNAGVHLTENVKLHSDGSKEISYIIEEAVLPFNTVLAMISCDMIPKMINFNLSMDEYKIIKELFDGEYTYRIEQRKYTVIEIDNYVIIFTHTNNTINYSIYRIDIDDIVASYSWDIDMLDSIDAISWDAVQSIDDLIGSV